ILSKTELNPATAARIELGLQHEQQHQELILTDIKHLFSCNPLAPVYRPAASQKPVGPVEMEWHKFGDGLRRIGYAGAGFCFDNELPRHREFVEAFEIASRLVTNEEFLRFINDGGYQRPELWLSDGWTALEERGWRYPEYWIEDGDGWQQ